MSRSRAQTFVEAIADGQKTALDSLKDHARTVSLPAMLHRNGLLQTVTFLEAKAEGCSGRNGARAPDLQTVTFLEAKAEAAVKKDPDKDKATAKTVTGPDGRKDRTLLDLLRFAVRSVVPDADLTAPALAKCRTETYLLYTEVALEAAAWIARLADARAELEKERGS